ncbi:hypothetical protein [Sporocytophaga myxococcoides]|uniref:hypothetical protein n=1 Tax=Sporocytophaga myxococcoides TaxID=153721 RepID=UPI000401D7A1|nr:hypothetical protein [Sporocytophaga myxococcoides]
MSFLLNGSPLLLSEISWLTIGEKLNSSTSMYRDIWYPAGPLASSIYYFLNLIFGKSQTALWITSTLFVIFQAVIFNLILNAVGALRDRSVLPALFYFLFATLFFDFNTLFPVLLGTTFLLIALFLIFQQLRNDLKEEHMLYSGVFIGIAALFSIQLGLFFFFAFLSYLFFGVLNLRKFLLLIVGFAFPFLIAWTYYFLKNGSSEFVTYYVLSFVNYKKTIYGSLQLYILILLTPAIMMLFSFFIIANSSRYVNFQYNLIKSMLLWIIFGVFSLALSNNLTPSSTFIFVPALAFFASHMFSLIRHKVFSESFFAGTIIFILGISFIFSSKASMSNKTWNINSMVASPLQSPFDGIKGKKVLVLGKFPEMYINNTLATPYLDWQLAEKRFDNLNNFENISGIYRDFLRDSPDFIVDKSNLAEKIFAKIPSLGAAYKKVDEGLYEKVQPINSIY